MIFGWAHSTVTSANPAAGTSISISRGGARDHGRGTESFADSQGAGYSRRIRGWTRRASRMGGICQRRAAMPIRWALSSRFVATHRADCSEPVEHTG
jgi:hypothetical protein